MDRRLLLLLLLVLTACGTPPTPRASMGEASIGPDGGSVATTDGSARLVVPPFALNETATIRISRNDGAEFPAAYGRPVGFGVTLEPSGTQFSVPARLIVEYDPGSLPEDVLPRNIRLLVSSEDGWSRLSDIVVNTADRTVAGELSHFSQVVQAVPEKQAATGFIHPIAADEAPTLFTQAFGEQDASDDGRLAQGPDYGDALGTPVIAAGDGYIHRVQEHHSNGLMLGNAIELKYYDSDQSGVVLYDRVAHLQESTPSVEHDFSYWFEKVRNHPECGPSKSHPEHEFLCEGLAIPVAQGTSLGGVGTSGAGWYKPHLDYTMKLFGDPIHEGHHGWLYPDSHPALHGLINPVDMIEPVIHWERPEARSIARADYTLRFGPGKPGTDLGEHGYQIHAADLPVGLEVFVYATADTGRGCNDVWYKIGLTNDYSEYDERAERERDGTVYRDVYFIDPHEGDDDLLRHGWVCGEALGGTTDPDPDDDPDAEPGDVDIVGFGTSIDGFRVDFFISVGFEGDLTDAACTLSISDGREIDVSRCTHQSFYETVSFSGPGTYTATLDVTNGVTSDSESVTFEIEPLVCTMQAGCGTASFDLEPNRIELEGVEGAAMTTTVVLENNGGASGDFDVTSPAWVFVTPGSGTIDAGGTTRLTITANCPSDATGTLRISGDATAEASIERTCEPPPEPLVTLENLDFEGGGDSWDIVDDAYIGADAHPNNGQWYAALGVDANGYPTNNADGRIVQAFTVPSDATTADLSFYYNLVTDWDHSSNEDRFLVGLTQEPADAFEGTFFGFQFTAGQQPHATDGDYEYRSNDVDVSRWQGEIVYLVLEGKTDSTFTTILRVDDLDLSFR